MNDVNVVISLTKASARVGFGYPLIFAGVQSADIEYTEVSSLAEVVTAGFAAETDVYKAAALLFQQDDAPAKIAVCADTAKATAALPAILDKDWRQLIVVSGGVEGEDSVDVISDYIEGCGKVAMYFCSVGTGDEYVEVIENMAGNTRTIAIVYDSDDTAYPEAALVGATAGLEAGSFTYKNIILKGVTPQTYTSTQVEGMHKNGLITVLKKAGSVVTSEGIVVEGEYADIIDSKDYIVQQIETDCQSLLNRVPKLPYDNKGIAALEGVVLSVLMDAANKGMIAQNEDGYEYSVNFGTRADASPTDISNRHYAEGSFTFTLAGAIHTATINGEIIA